MADVPEPIRSSLRRDSGKSVVVMFYGDEDYGRIDVKKIDQLGVTNLDLKRSRFPGIILKYNLALGDLTGCNFLCSGFRICIYGFRFLTITVVLLYKSIISKLVFSKIPYLNFIKSTDWDQKK